MTERTRSRTTPHASYTNARPMVPQMKTSIRRVVLSHPSLDVEDIAHKMFLGFVHDGLVEDTPWGEDLVLSLMMAEVDAMWANAEVV